MEPIYFTDDEYLVTQPSANIVSTRLNLFGAENVLVGGLVRNIGNESTILYLFFTVLKRIDRYESHKEPHIFFL